jgi:hypothetical protein
LSLKLPGHPGLEPEDDPGQVDPALIRLAVTAMHVTVFFSLLGLGYPAEQALPLTAAVGLGGVTVADRFLRNRRGRGPGSPR